MPLKIVILCHVEPGIVLDRTIQFGFGYTEGIAKTMPTLVEFADAHGVPMGFVLTAISHDWIDVDLDGHDVGVHLHPRDPVLDRHLGGRVHLDHDCLARYSESDQRVFVDTACEIYRNEVGRDPKLFVAGRWSENGATARLLSRAGFTHDASALPGYHTECADWSGVPRLAQPFAIHPSGAAGDGRERITLLPVYEGLWGHHLTPETIRDLGVSYYKAALLEAHVGGADMVQFYLHSPLALDPIAMDAFGEVLDYADSLPGTDVVRPTSIVPSVHPRSRPFPPAYLARLDWTFLKSLGGRGMVGRRIRASSPTVSDPYY